METPKSRRQESVEAQSRAVEKFEISDGPWASAAIKAARCEMELSPGKGIRPQIRCAGASFMFYKYGTRLLLRTPSAGFPLKL